MEYRKERNFICGYEGNKFVGGWDIITGKFIGARRSPVKNKPRDLFGYNFNPSYYEKIFTFWNSHFHAPYNYNCGQRMEEFVSLQLMPNSLVDFNCNIKLTKDLVSFLHEKCDSRFSIENVKFYNFLKKQKNINDLNTKTIQVLMIIYKQYHGIKIDDNIIKLLHILQHEHVIDTKDIYEIALIISQYIDFQEKMYGQIEIKRNFMTNYTILEYLYSEFEKINYNKILKEKNDLPYLYFEDDILFARPLLTKEEFHIEAEYQQNCVERLFMSRVKDGTTHVVVIRKKDEPDTPYITCEVNNYYIVQYFGRFNRYPTDNDAIIFRNSYSAYLKEESGKNA